jgi:hypothetical protein
MPDANGYFTYSEWEKWAVDKIAGIAFHWKLTHEESREDYLRVQIQAMIRQALAHGRSGRSNDDPVIGPLDKGPLP